VAKDLVRRKRITRDPLTNRRFQSSYGRNLYTNQFASLVPESAQRDFAKQLEVLTGENTEDVDVEPSASV